jgi:hypothetical protein
MVDGLMWSGKAQEKRSSIPAVPMGKIQILRTARGTAILDPRQQGKWEFPISLKPPL